ncbi:MAG TPA: LytTR family DNA-binding domain-containing protein [Bacteroidales bacterium]|nr:LytTR family DNA-binding domain-containing protein [Bacteroidales bacterium]HOH22005.1 LytTR family DNA-binding domain-containing protein [Bacteroidales bacterium]HPZ03463.1 LytTR family DNA-binding domain-containing protein [Bacteroidales bacterium]HQB74927.1 LytTR family DNA-binding domain-containing protein [Bacteroidales bacterium]
MLVNNSTLEAVLVEDDESAQQVVHKLLSDYPRVELVEVFPNSKEALQFLDEHPVDLLFLAINLPDINGFQLLERLDKDYPVIFTTVDINHAISSFEYNVIDFLQKPINSDHFERAVNRAIQRLSLHNCGENHKRSCPLRINLPIGACGMPIEIDRILFIQSWGNYVKIHMEDEAMIVSLSTQKVLEMLPSSQFVRVHRSYIVNKDWVRSCNTKELIIDCDSVEMNTIPIGVSYRQSIREKLEIDESTSPSPSKGGEF